MLRLLHFVRKIVLLNLIGISLSWSILYALPTQAEEAEDAQPNWLERIIRRFQRPKEIGSAPGSHQSGANRECPTTSDDPLTAFVPKGNSGLTYVAQPTFWFYMPYTNQMLSPELEEPVEFVLVEAVERGPEVELYRQRYALPTTPGIVSIELPETVPALEFDKRYRWVFVVHCQENNPSSAAAVDGSVERVEVDSDWEEELAAATTLEEQARLYSEEKLWYDMIDVIAQQYQNNPDDPSVVAAWSYILGFVDLCSKAAAPPADYCASEEDAQQE